VIVLFHELTQHSATLFIELRRSTEPRFRLERLRLAGQPKPSIHRGFTHPEQLCDLGVGALAGPIRGDDSLANLYGYRVGHRPVLSTADRSVARKIALIALTAALALAGWRRRSARSAA